MTNVPSQQYQLTPRQHEVLALAAEGYSNAAIAQELNLNVTSVASCLNITYQKLDVAHDPARNARVQAVLRYQTGV